MPANHGGGANVDVLTTMIEKTVRGAEVPMDPEDVISALARDEFDPREVRDEILRLLESGALALDWGGKLRARAESTHR